MKILIVEDDPMVGDINSRFASRLPFVEKISLADSLEKAKAELEKEAYDLMLLDVYFPTGRGPDLLQWVRNREISVDVIFITADKSPATVERALHLGAADYLVKPFTFARFKKAVEDVRQRMDGVERQQDFDQEALDQIFLKSSNPESSLPGELDKGMSYKTYELVRKEVLSASKPFTAEQMGERLGIARVTIRRYLDFMEKQELLEVELRYGRIGRPQHFYRVKGQP